LSLKSLLDFLGFNSPKWRWRIYRAERALKEAFQKQEGPRRLTMKRCLRCGGLSPVTDRRCVTCGSILLPAWLNWLPLRLTSADIPATWTLLSLNFIWFVLALVLEGPKGLMSPSTDTLIRTGAQFWPYVFQGQFYRVITYAFVHIGFIHFAFNMVVLYQIAPIIERETGRFFIFLYTFTAVTATGAGLLFHPLSPTAGASGSLFGLIGFMIVYAHRLGNRGLRNFMVQWALYALVFGFLVGADNAGHVGGALGGLFLGAVLPMRREVLRSLQQVLTLGAFLSWMAIAAGLITVVIRLL